MAALEPSLLDRKQSREGIRQAGLFIVLGLLSTAFLLPFLWMVSTSLKPIEETMKMPPTFIPVPPRWANYAEAVSAIPFFRYAWNTVVVCVLGAAGTIISSGLVAYGFAYLRWPGRDLFFWLTVSTMMVPFPVLMVPLYGVFRSLGWIGTLFPLWA
ncbi:MAG: carbohydrate ABC transporter permease, partial [bacterium]